MATNGVKTFSIKINGIQESIDAVSALNKQLANLEGRINVLSSAKSVGTKVSGGGGTSSSSKSSLSEEEKLERQIEQIDAKRVAYSKEIYQNYLAAKDVLSETVKDQKSVAASERLQAKSYSNTIAGMKQEFADIKEVMQTVDLGDTDQIDKLTQRANELNDALAKIKTTYEQFGQSAGNYGDAFKDLQKVTLTVNGVEREFKNATVASRTLNKELEALQINGKGNTKQADELRKVINKLNSDIKDATVSSKAMDTAMDWMESFTAMASVGKGLKAVFGIDDTEITKSIQQLVALQGVLQGVEKIHKQIDSGEGIGEIFGKWFKNIDKYSNRLLAMNRAMLGTGTSAKIAAAGIKVLSGALKTIVSFGVYEVIELAQVAIGKLIGSLKDWVKGDADLISSTDAVNAAIDSQNKILEERLKLVQANMNANNITPEQARVETEKSYAKALEETNKRLKEREDILGRNNMRSPRKGTINLDSVMGDEGTTTVGGFDKAIESIDDFINRWDELEKAVNNERGFSTMLSTASDAKAEFEHLAKLVGRDFVNAIHLFSDGTQEGARQLSRYIDKMDELTGGRYSKAIQLVKVDNEALQKELDEAWKLVQNLRDNIFKNPIIVKIELDTKIEQELDRLDPTRPMQRQLDEWKGLLKKGVNEAGDKLSVEEVANINKIIKEQDKALKKARRDRAKSERNDAKAIANETENYRKQLRELQIQNMEEGWAKEKAALKEELRQKLFIIKNNGVKVKQLELETRKLYNKKIQDAEREHNAKMAAIYKESWDEIYRISDASTRMNLDSQLQQMETAAKQIEDEYTKIFTPQYASYGGTRFNNNTSNNLREELGYWSETGNEKHDFDIQRAKEYLNLVENIKLAEAEARKASAIGKMGEQYQELLEKPVKEATKALQDWLDKNEVWRSEMEEDYSVEELRQNGYTQSISNAYKIRIDETQEYYRKLQQMQKLHSEEVMNNELALLKNEENAEKRAEQDRFENQMAELNANLRDGLMTRQHYDELVVRAQIEHSNSLEAISKRASTEEERIQQEHVDRLKQITSDGLRGMLNEYRDAFAAISNIQSRQPQLAKGDWGIVSITATTNSYKEALEAYKQLSNDIIAEKISLQEKLDNNEITFDDFQQAKRELDGLAQDTADAAQDVQENLKNVVGAFMQSIQQYISAAKDSFMNIMQAVWSAQDNENEKEAERLDKLNEIIENKLNEQEAIVEKHKSNIDSIEDELASARGDRRQHLIDQLNAEMQAQREAAAEQKRLQKEKEANERKQDELEKKRKKQQYHRDMIQAIVNGAMAVTMAAVNKWPIPAIPMMALAASTTAAQIAIMASNKPYAKGGLLEGPSHKEGGIPVGNTGIEVEGKEYVIRKSSTAPNIEILDYINKSERKLNLDDFIDFYSSGKLKKNIVQMSPRSRFANGGSLPTISTNYSFDDRLLTAFEDYSNRPVVCQVVDVINKMDDVRYVQTLAGLQPKF